MTSSAAAAATADVVSAGVDFSVWKAIAGNTVEVPSLGSRVYYFPEGHAEHINNYNCNSNLSAATAIVSSFGLPASLPPFFLCRVLRVQFLADPQTEQVFAKLLLFPVHWDDDSDMPNVNFALREMHGDVDGEIMEADNGDVVSFSKILTPSDANNGGGFSVPRFCADSIFPPLDFDAEPPVQNLCIRDINGNVFDFRHIYRGTPRRHLLTTGWSKFVNSKKLVAGDSVVFTRKRSTGELFVGLRRALKGGGGATSKWSSAAMGAGAVKLDQNGISYGGEAPGFWRSAKGKPVLQAVEKAAKGMAFEVLYYPRPGWADFVVNAEMVEQSINVPWNAGMRIKMSMETEDSSRMTWSHGTVLSVCLPDNGPQRGSPWRMLQIKWDEHDILKNFTRVSPWEVEYVVQTTSLRSAFPPMKKIKVLQNPEFPPCKGEELLQPMLGVSNSMLGHLGPSFQNYTSSASMQGARQDQFCLSSLSNFGSDVIYPAYCDSFINNGVKSELKTVSTELNIGGSLSENFSPDSQSSVHYSGSELAGKAGASTPLKVGVCSFRLFGKVIHMEEPLEDGSDFLNFTDGESKVFKDIEGINNPIDLSLTCSKLLDMLDVQCQRASAVEACPLKKWVSSSSRR